jgi:hypothetical protein
MVGVFVTFRYPDGVDTGAVTRIAEAAGGQFRGMPGLRSKAFTIDAENGEATNFYVWESEEAARAFFTPGLTERVTALYGVAPVIRYVQIAEFVDNT